MLTALWQDALKKDIAFTDEMWDSVCDNWWDKVEAIQDFPEIHLEKRLQAFGPYWKQQKEAWTQNLSSRLKAFKEQDERWGPFSHKDLLEKELLPKVMLSGWEQDLNKAIEEKEAEDCRSMVDLQIELRRMYREDRPKSELYEICRKIR
jgi:hypothetical protein